MEILFDPTNNPIHALRLEFGDVDEYDYILTDESYQYYLNKYPLSPKTVSKYVGNAILAKLAKDGFRQRVGQEEAFLGERYKNYLDWLKQKVSNPLLSGAVPAVYVVIGSVTEFPPLMLNVLPAIESVCPSVLSKYGARFTVEVIAS